MGPGGNSRQEGGVLPANIGCRLTVALVGVEGTFRVPVGIEVVVGVGIPAVGVVVGTVVVVGDVVGTVVVGLVVGDVVGVKVGGGV